MRKAIRNDIHKMRAFVRFRRVMQDDIEQYVAWYRPDHYILGANERFFVERFGAMHWAILTPDGSLVWDTQQVRYGPGVPRSEAPAEDELEDLWRAYYASIYNPARRNLDAMRAQLPVRRWQDLPESRLIPELVRLSPGRVESMIDARPASASEFIPRDADLPLLREAVHHCRACELCALATQPVFGEGPPDARILVVGEQPGDEEDHTGHPFVGPAGRVLDAAEQDPGGNLHGRAPQLSTVAPGGAADESRRASPMPTHGRDHVVARLLRAFSRVAGDFGEPRQFARASRDGATEPRAVRGPRRRCLDVLVLRAQRVLNRTHQWLDPAHQPVDPAQGGVALPSQFP